MAIEFLNRIRSLHIILLLLISAVIYYIIMLLFGGIVLKIVISLLPYCYHGPSAYSGVGCLVFDSFIAFCFVSLFSYIAGILSLIILKVGNAVYIGLFSGTISLISAIVYRSSLDSFIFYMLGLIVGYCIFTVLKLNILVKIAISFIIIVLIVTLLMNL